jgi:SSS family solute:Na+ symporter
VTGLDYGIVIAFLSVMALGGFWISRLIKDSDDFFVAGRELTPYILAATITATNVSMFHFVGMGGTAYKEGVSMIWQNWTGCMALVLSGCFVLPFMRRLRIRSVPEFLEMRYSRGLRTMVGIFWGIRLCLYLGLLLNVAATTAIVITGWNNYAAWLLIFSLVAILYSVVGGAWAVAIMDSGQFLVMLIGAMIVLPIAMHFAGGLPSLLNFLHETQPRHVELVPQSGNFNWVFICSILLLSIKWSMIDQAILQRAFGAKSPRVGAKGMVLSGLITIPLAFFWILPGLAVTRLHPEPFANENQAIPWLLATQLPAVAKGLLGIVLCGLVAAQISTITADVNSVATLFTSDVYRTLKRQEPTQRQLLYVVRISSLACGALMLIVAWFLQYGQTGAVNVNLVIVGILDMPLFVIAVIYGLFWKRIEWMGAVAGFIGGGLAWVAGYLWLDTDTARKAGPIISGAAALVITPLVSLLVKHKHRAEAETIWASMNASTNEEGEIDNFHLVPTSMIGKLSLGFIALGFAVFLFGVLSAHWAFAGASMLAVVGMLTTYVGGLVRVYTE